jgi:parallel beta helix pectate lyase-like protein
VEPQPGIVLTSTLKRGEMKAMKSFRRLAFGLTMAGFIAGAARAGNLEPPGIPAPTMKTLDEVEPCTLISAHGFTIDAPGSYCLTKDLNAEDDERDGIVIKASNVTLDLRGFTIAGRIGGAERGIFGSETLLAVVIRNGTVSGWAGGGIVMSQASDSRFENLRVLENAGSGIVVGADNQITDCMIQGNQGLRGIEVGARASILRSTITGNGNVANPLAGHGILVSGGNATISDSTIAANLGNGITDATDSNIRGCHIASNGGDGIKSASGSMIVDCTVVYNGLSGIGVGDDLTISGCTIKNNAMFGINGGARMKISDCTVSSNTQGGITVSASSYVLNNHVANNGDGDGIRVDGSGSRVDGNSVTGQGCGIDSPLGVNLFIRNSARGNTGLACPLGQAPDFKFAPGALYGTIVSNNTALNGASNDLVNIILP